MLNARMLLIIAVAGLGWAFSPYLELLSGHPSQRGFDAHTRMGLFENDEGVNILISIDADEGLRAFDVQAKIVDKSIPLSWRLSPPDGDVFQIANRNCVVTGSHTFLGGSAIEVSSTSGAFKSKFLRDERPPYQQHLAEFENDGVELAATVFAPVENANGIGVVMIHGSGKSDRNNLWYVAQADYLARKGFTVLLPDKRGSGRSGGLWKTATISDLADDANAAVEALRKLDAVSLERIGLLGLSQGGHTAPVAASKNDNVDFVVNVVGSLQSFNEGLSHESANLFREHTPDILIPPLIFIADTVARARIPLWWVKNGSFDPKPYWRELDVPGLIIWGEHDEFENVGVVQSAKYLEEINDQRTEAIAVKIYPGMGHGLFDETGWISQDYLSYLAKWMENNDQADLDEQNADSVN